MAEDRFVHLHVHSDYSFQDGLCRIPLMVEHIRSLGQPALALTDHGNLHGFLQFMEACESAGIRPIPGCEMYLAPGSRHEKRKDATNNLTSPYYHLVLLAYNDEGLRNLFALSSMSFLEGFYHRPRIDFELLEQHHEGLICLSGCLQGPIQHAILQGKPDDEVEDFIKRFLNIFGNDRFYIELQYHGMDEDRRLIPKLLELAYRFDIPVVATNDAHYIRREDSRLHEVRVRISTNTPVGEPVPLGFPGGEFYLKSREEMEATLYTMRKACGLSLSDLELLSFLDHTVTLAERVHVKLPPREYKLPYFPVPESEDIHSYFRKKVLREFETRRLPRLKKLEKEGLLKHPLTEYENRLQHELDTIIQMNFSGYFLIVSDFIEWAKTNGIPVGPGRGSAAGSLVSYSLGITDIDPLQYELLFERFLNPERISMPDIDVDFCAIRRDKVIDYVREKYGKESVAQIITFSTFAARGAIRDVGRILNVPLHVVDQIAKQIPMGPGVTLRKVIEEDRELARLLDDDRPEIRDMMHIAMQLEGVVRNAGTHAAGIVIAPGKLMKYVPLCLSKEGDVQTQVDMNALDRLGLLKMDFLGLINLTIIDDCIRRIRHHLNVSIDLNDIPLDDPDTFKLFCEGKTDGIFQFESSGMKDLLRRFKPQRFEDLIALNALYRPGPMQMLDEFIDRRHGRKPIEYELRELEPILAETYGIIVYQEQVMQIAAEIAGFSMAEADNLRRAMAKKKRKEMDELRPRFIEGAKKRGVPESKAVRLFERMEHFASYGFNKSHSTAYAYIAYQTAWLKTHYPVYYMASLLSHRMNNADDLAKYIQATRQMGIEVLPPDINESNEDFTVIDDKRIRFGFAGVKGLGPAAVKAILQARAKEGIFRSFQHFVSVVDNRAVNKKAIEALVKAGAFDSFGLTRRALFESIEIVLEHIHSRKRKLGRYGTTIPSVLPGLEPYVDIVDTVEVHNKPEWDERLKLSYEKDILGVYITGHPLERYEQEMNMYRTHTVATLKESQPGGVVRLGGILSKLNIRKSRRGHKYGQGLFEDGTGSIEVFCPPQVLEACRDDIQTEIPLVAEGVLEADEGRQRFILQEVWGLTRARNELLKGFCITVRVVGASPSLPEKLRTLFEEHPGHLRVYLKCMKPGHFTVYLRTKYAIQVTQDFLVKLEELMPKLEYIFIRSEHDLKQIDQKNIPVHMS